MKTRTLLPLGLLFGASLALLSLMPASAQAPSVNPLSAELLKDLAIQGDIGTTSKPVAADVRTRALNAAAAYEHRTEDPAGVFPAISSRYADDPPQDVVVVVYNGGRSHAIGPRSDAESAQSSNVLFEGVIIDAATGEVLRGFSLAR